jgi:hypothetical protein
MKCALNAMPACLPRSSEASCLLMDGVLEEVSGPPPGGFMGKRKPQVEVAFSDQDAFLGYMGKLFGPEAVDDAVAVDEAKFLDRSQTRAYVVDEHVTAG